MEVLALVGSPPFSAGLVGLRSHEVDLFCLLDMEVEAWDCPPDGLVAPEHQELCLCQELFLDPSPPQSEEGSWGWAFHPGSRLEACRASLSWGRQPRSHA